MFFKLQTSKKLEKRDGVYLFSYDEAIENYDIFEQKN